jgi:hypothetical protein
MENTTAAVEEALRPRVKKKIFFSSGDIVMHENTTIPNRPFMIVQSIDKLPVASGDGFAARSNRIWFSSDLKLQKSRFSTRDIIKKPVND